MAARNSDCSLSFSKSACCSDNFRQAASFYSNLNKIQRRLSKISFHNFWAATACLRSSSAISRGQFTICKRNLSLVTTQVAVKFMCDCLPSPVSIIKLWLTVSATTKIRCSFRSTLRDHWSLVCNFSEFQTKFTSLPLWCFPLWQGDSLGHFWASYPL